ncbi:MAG: hypothetical protein LBL00_03950, partial [Endomicrobium sp.]|nr:hypothetical protein [Endomicrobium sp.]
RGRLQKNYSISENFGHDEQYFRNTYLLPFIPMLFLTFFILHNSLCFQSIILRACSHKLRTCTARIFEEILLFLRQRYIDVSAKQKKQNLPKRCRSPFGVCPKQTQLRCCGSYQ